MNTERAVIDPTAVIHPKAEIEPGVTIGPYAIVGEHLKIGRGTTIGSHAVLSGWTEIGEDCRIFPFASIGEPPQDFRYRDEETHLIIGRNNVIREFVTIHRGTPKGRGETVIGNDGYFMAYVHIAHDCVIGDRVVMANNASLAGHITIGEGAIIGGLTGIHQFVRIGRLAMVGGCSGISQDVPPFLLASGGRAGIVGLNLVGLKRHGFSEERITILKQSYKILFRSRLMLRAAIERLRQEPSPDVQEVVKFIEGSERGILRERRR